MAERWVRVPSPDDQKALRLFMAQRKRAWKSNGWSGRAFPKFIPGLTKTADYVRAFGCKHIDMARLGDRLAPYITGPEVIAERLVE